MTKQRAQKENVFRQTYSVSQRGCARTAAAAACTTGCAVRCATDFVMAHTCYADSLEKSNRNERACARSRNFIRAQKENYNYK